MNIYLVRHGIAEDRASNQSDAERALTHEGRIKMSLAAKGWKQMIDGFDCLVSSPLKRALQTAQIVQEVFNINEDIIVNKKLSPGSRTEDLIDIALEQDGMDIVFFGHEPDFSEHVSKLISNSGAGIEFKKGAIAKIAFYGKPRLGGGTLEFLIPAKAFK